MQHEYVAASCSASTRSVVTARAPRSAHARALVLQILLGEVDGTPGLISDKLQVGAHTEAVWQVKWVARQDVGEVLVSVSTDGRVTQWDCKKGAFQ